jgi:hypothetical protein
VCQHVRVAATLVACVPILVACGRGPGSYGLPEPLEYTGTPVPTVQWEVPGPARIDAEEFHFHESGQEAVVDLERSSSGTTADLSYDHITGKLSPINRAEVSLYSRYSGWWGNEPEDRTDFPGEHECEQKRDEDWRETFSEEDLAAEYSSFCIRTSEGHLGFLFIRPDDTQKPKGYRVYSHTWVR